MARILLADDQPMVRKSIGRLLQTHGNDVTTAADGQEALDTLTREEFDLAVLDIWMPRLGGIELLRALRAVRPVLPVIVISGGGHQAPLEYSVAVAQMEGATAVLVKPVEDDALLSAVREALSAA